MTRKQKLRDRAYKVAKGCVDQARDPNGYVQHASAEIAAWAYMRGYRDAIKDLRRELKKQGFDASDTDLMHAVGWFLNPIR